MAPVYTSVGTVGWLIDNEFDVAIDGFGEKLYANNRIRLLGALLLI